MTYEEYEKQRLGKNNITNTTLSKTQKPTISYEEYEKKRLNEINNQKLEKNLVDMSFNTIRNMKSIYQDTVKNNENKNVQVNNSMTFNSEANSKQNAYDMLRNANVTHTYNEMTGNTGTLEPLLHSNSNWLEKNNINSDNIRNFISTKYDKNLYPSNLSEYESGVLNELNKKHFKEGKLRDAKSNYIRDYERMKNEFEKGYKTSAITNKTYETMPSFEQYVEDAIQKDNEEGKGIGGFFRNTGRLLKQSYDTGSAAVATGVTNIYDTAKANFKNNYNSLTGQNIDPEKLVKYNSDDKNLEGIMDFVKLGEKVRKPNASKELTTLYEQLKNKTFTGNKEDIQKVLLDAETEEALNDIKKTQWARNLYADEASQNNSIGGITGTVANASGVVGNMLPTMGATMINPALGDLAIYANASGGAYSEALQNGANYKQALDYSNLSGALELGVEKISGGLSNGFLGSKPLLPIGSLTQNVKNKFVKWALDTTLDVTGEGLEEVVSTLIQPYIERATYNPNATNATNATAGEVVESFTSSILPTLMLGGTSTALQKTAQFFDKTYAEIDNSSMSEIQKENMKNEVAKAEQEIKNKISKQVELGNNNSSSINLQKNAQNTSQVENTSQNSVQNVSNLENTVRNEAQIQEETVGTNIGNIPIAEYRDIMAQQAGFNDYADMRRQGYKLGNNYDTNAQETNKEQIQNKATNDTEKFAQQVDELMSGTFNKQNMITVLRETPPILQELGFDNLPVTITPNKLERVIKESGNQNRTYHNLGIDVVKQLPEAIANPLDIIKSHNNSVVLTTYLADKNDNTVIVSIKLDGKGNINNIEIPTNVMTSAYGRNNYDAYMEKNIREGNLLYDIDRGIIKKEALSTQGLQLSNDTNASNESGGKRLELPSNSNSSSVSSTTNTPTNNIIQSDKNYVNNKQINSPTQAEQQAELEAKKSKFPTQAEQQAEMEARRAKLPTKEKKNNSKPNFMLVNEKDSYKRNMLNNNAKAINDLIKAKNEITNELTLKINAKQQLYNSKKDKTTKTAQNLKNQIINLQKRKADIEEKLIKKIDRLETQNANINRLKKQVSDDRLPTRKEIKQEIITQTDMDNINLDNVKDVSKWTMNNTIPLRVNEKIFDRDTATKINDTFFKPIKHNEAERIRFLNKERAEIEALKIKPRSEESEYVQIYGEGEWVNPSTGETTPYTLKDLQMKFPERWEEIKKAAEVIRSKYDTYLDAVNKELNKMGYDSIPKLKNYFRHFEETTSLLDQIGIPSKADNLPTDMNGLTSDLRPGKNFFANALSRTGKKTTYDAITGIDGYLEGVSKLMYHTEDIQKLRTFDEYIRGKYGKNAKLEGLNKADFEKRVEQIQEGHLSEYASWLTEYTNTLAGKKSKMDRGTEEALGRRVYGTLNAIKKQVGSNLTGLNLNSALSNFISITQGASKTSKFAMLEGFGDTLKNIFVKDNFINESDFLTRRFGSDKLSKTTWENISNAGQIFMAGTDYLSANIITRSKYYEYLNKGYPKNEAIKLADEFADRIMGGRALGDMPNIFNSKTLGILTQFQLENVNQFDAMFHDTKYENRANEQTKYEAKTWNEKIKSNLAKSNPKFYNGLTATFILGQLFAYAWAYNKVDEELTGSGGAFDPLGILEDLIKDFMNPDISTGDALKNFAKNAIDVIPYANTLTGGGRVPMTDALPNLADLLEGEGSVSSELWKIANLALPTGGGQLRKSIQGAIALAQGGDYKTNSEGEKQLKFPIAQDGTTGEKIAEGAQAVLFGKWATPGGKRYIESGFKPLSKVQTKGIEKARKLGISTEEFYDIKKRLQNIKVPTLKNKEGKDEAIPGARKQLMLDELNKTDLNYEQKKLFYDIFYTKEIK